MVESAGVQNLDEYREAASLKLDAESVEIVAAALEVEWDSTAKAAAAEIAKAFGGTARKTHLADAAWKVRRQAAIVRLLEQLGEVA